MGAKRGAKGSGSALPSVFSTVTSGRSAATWQHAGSVMVVAWPTTWNLPADFGPALVAFVAVSDMIRAGGSWGIAVVLSPGARRA
jgi:hypothetical protein